LTYIVAKNTQAPLAGAALLPLISYREQQRALRHTSIRQRMAPAVGEK